MTRRSTILTWLATASAAALIASGAPAAVATDSGTAAVGRYIVRTSAGPAATGSALASIPTDRILHRYSEALDGFAAELTTAEVAALRRLSSVVDVTADAPTRADAEQSDPTWGLDRIDQRSSARDGVYRYDTTGAGVTAYVLDTGVQASHSEFGGRVGGGWDFVDADADARTDCNGHGTHVAGTIAGARYGVAKAMTVVPVRVWGCSGGGYFSDLIAGIDWAIGDRSGPAVINISGGGGSYLLADQAVERAVSSGLAVVVSAGNEARDACSTSPARTANALTVGATDPGDRAASYSNHGSCLDVWAPGSSVVSAAPGSSSATASLSGTSMAAPHVTGVVGRLLQSEPVAQPARLTALVTSSATPVIHDGNGSPSGLLHAAGTTAPTVPTVPVGSPLTAGTPSISGTARVGSTLTASPGTWSPSPVAFTYQWTADGTALSGATGSTYKPTPAALGRRIAVAVTGTRTGYTTAGRTSAATAAVVAGTLAAVTPTVTGTAKVGATLTASPGAWGPAPVSLTYRWKAAGAAITGATASTYTPTSGTLGRTITVTVTGTKTGYATASRTSGATPAVANGTLTAPTPTVSGTARVGSTLTAAPGAWGPGTVALTYQWRAGGVALSGATASTYRPTSSVAGTTITVTVTGRKTAYTSVSRTSAATAAVAR